MKKAILATKVGMTQIFNEEDGVLIPVTVLQAGPWSSCSIAVCQSRTFPLRMSLPRQNLFLHLYPLCRNSPVNMQMFCPMAQESSQLHTMKITLLSGVADPDVQRYFRFPI